MLSFLNRDNVRQHAVQCFLREVGPLPIDYKVAVPDKHQHHRFLLFYAFGTLDTFLSSNLLHVLFSEDIQMFVPAQQMTIYDVRGKWSAALETETKLLTGPKIKNFQVGPMHPLRRLESVKMWFNPVF
jgi:hypothetical protein